MDKWKTNQTWLPGKQFCLYFSVPNAFQYLSIIIITYTNCLNTVAATVLMGFLARNCIHKLHTLYRVSATLYLYIYICFFYFLLENFVCFRSAEPKLHAKERFKASGKWHLKAKFKNPHGFTHQAQSPWFLPYTEYRLSYLPPFWIIPNSGFGRNVRPLSTTPSFRIRP